MESSCRKALVILCIFMQPGPGQYLYLVSEQRRLNQCTLYPCIKRQKSSRSSLFFEDQGLFQMYIFLDEVIRHLAPLCHFGFCCFFCQVSQVGSPNMLYGWYHIQTRLDDWECKKKKMTRWLNFVLHILLVKVNKISSKIETMFWI